MSSDDIRTAWRYLAAFCVLTGAISLLAHWRSRATLNDQLMRAAAADDAPKVTALLQSGANPNAVVEWETGQSWALGRQYYGPPGNALGSPPLSPLTVAAYTGSSNAAEVLLDGGADANRQDGQGRTPLEAALLALSQGANDRQTILALLSHHADPNNPGGNMQPLQAVVGDPDLLAAFLRAGARVNAADRSGVTALMVAAQMGAEPSVRVLLTAGADPAMRDRAGRTAADRWRGSIEVSQLLQPGAAPLRQTP